MSPKENAGFGGGADGFSFFSAAGLAAAAAAAALSAFVVPGRLEAELKVVKRLAGLGAETLGLGRGAAAAGGLPATSTLRLDAPLAGAACLFVSLGLDVTTMLRFVAGCALLSPSRGRLEPATSADEESADEPFNAGESSLVVLGTSCFRFEEAVALSKILLPRSLVGCPPFLMRRGSSLIKFVFCNISSSTVTNRAKSCIVID